MRQFLTNLAAVLFRPRATMRRILDAPRDRAVIPLFLLAVISGMVGDLDAPMLEQTLGHSRGPQVALIVVCVVFAVIVVFVAIAWLYAWIPMYVGRFLGGTGSVRGVRSAIAWGLAPAIWALLYRVPAAIWLAPSSATTVKMDGGRVNFDPGRLTQGCGVALVFMIIELGVFVWSTWVMSNTVAEAQGFSAWKGLGTLVISAIVPFVVLLAAVLAIS